MSKIRIDEADQLTVRDVVHEKLSALDANSTVAEVRAYFDASKSRRQAFLLDDGRYVGSLTADRVAAEPDPERLAAEFAEPGQTIGLDAPANVGRDLALRTDARRVAVIDDDGKLVGVIAVTGDLQHFCGTAERRAAVLASAAQRAARPG